MSRSETGRHRTKGIFAIRSDKDTHFTGAVAVGITENESLAGLESDKITILRVLVTSVENLAFTIAFFGANTFQDTDIDLDAYTGEVQFVAADGVRMNAAGFPQYYYDSGALEMPYIDALNSGTLNVAYVCRDAAGKQAGVLGSVVVTVGYEALQE